MALVPFYNIANRSHVRRRLTSQALVFCQRCVKKNPLRLLFCFTSQINSANDQYSVGKQVTIVVLYGYAPGHAILAARRPSVRVRLLALRTV